MIWVWHILSGTPAWVWALLALTIWLGWRDLRDHTTVPGRLAILPAIATGTSLFNAIASAQPLLSVPTWLLAAMAASLLGVLIARRRHLEITLDQRLWLSGSWFSLVFGLSIFTARYVMGVTAALHPALASTPGWFITNNAVSGGVAGIGLGWLTCLLVRYRRSGVSAALRCVR